LVVQNALAFYFVDLVVVKISHRICDVVGNVNMACGNLFCFHNIFIPQFLHKLIQILNAFLTLIRHHPLNISNLFVQMRPSSIEMFISDFTENGVFVGQSEINFVCIFVL